jgi:Icc-related predicted phosphoesterase
VRLLAFSDLHCDLGQAAELVRRSSDVDLVAGVGDFASVHSGLEETISAIAEIQVPTLLVPGNNESDAALREATARWKLATVLHGESATVDGLVFYGLGAGIPTTPWDWSFDLTEEEAAEMLGGCPEGAVMLVHSPPLGHVDVSGEGKHLGSAAVRDAIARKSPSLVLCGHIHESWGAESAIGGSRIVNLGPAGTEFEL